MKYNGIFVNINFDKIYYAKLSKKMAEKVEILVLLVYNIFEFLSDEHYI